MTTLQSTAELAWRQLFPQPSDEAAITREEFIETAKNQFAYETLMMAWKEKRDEGEFNVPSYLLTTVEKEVTDNKIDISDLNFLRSLPSEVFIQNIGGITCECEYVKSNVNLSQLLCDDDSMGDHRKPFYLAGTSIFFPKGTHKKTIPILYANNGLEMDDETYIDDAIAAVIREKLVSLYGGKTGKEDVTNNSSSNN